MEEKTREEKERESEEKFKEWLDKHKISYWYIEQSKKSFSPALKARIGKRPDFILLLPYTSFIITDVKYKNPAGKYDVFQIDAEETEKYINLQNYFNLRIWYVFSSDKFHYNTWYWIPSERVKEKGTKFQNKTNKEKYYYSVPLSEFIQISSADSVDRLFKGIYDFLEK